jgi:hypothetical protein
MAGEHEHVCGEIENSDIVQFTDHLLSHPGSTDFCKFMPSLVEFRWRYLGQSIIEKNSLLLALEMQVFEKLRHADKTVQDQKDECQELMDVAIEAYRELPLIVRARIENWSIDCSKITFQRRLSTGMEDQGERSSAVTYAATYSYIDVACKTLNVDVIAESPELLRMQNEITVLAKLRHPNIVAFYGASINSHSCTLVMELLNGGSLEDILSNQEQRGTIPCGSTPDRYGMLGPRQAMSWALDLLLHAPERAARRARRRAACQPAAHGGRRAQAHGLRRRPHPVPSAGPRSIQACCCGRRLRRGQHRRRRSGLDSLQRLRRRCRRGYSAARPGNTAAVNLPDQRLEQVLDQRPPPAEEPGQLVQVRAGGVGHCLRRRGPGHRLRRRR